MEYEILILGLSGAMIVLLVLNLIATLFGKRGAGQSVDMSLISKRLDEQSLFIRNEMDRDLSRLDLNFRKEIAQNREELSEIGRASCRERV